MTCRNGHRAEPTDRFCATCGAQIESEEAPIECACGHGNAPSSSFCGYCGVPLNGSPEPSSVEETPQRASMGRSQEAHGVAREPRSEMPIQPGSVRKPLSASKVVVGACVALILILVLVGVGVALGRRSSSSSPQTTSTPSDYTPQPVYNTPQPVYNTPAPVYNAPPQNNYCPVGMTLLPDGGCA
jgi:hypothetical protein